MPQRIPAEDIPSFLKRTPEWDFEDDAIHRVVEFEDYMSGVEFVNDVAELAEDTNHHPDLTLSWCKVTILLTTHSKGGVTELDIDMARKIDAVID